MIQITAQMRVLVAIEPVDGRKGMDSLARLCQEKLAEDPFSGCVFVFRSRSGTAIRLLSYDGQGYWLAQKRLSRGRFVWWPEASGPAKSLEAYEVQLLMAAGDVSRVRAAPMWRRVSVLKYSRGSPIKKHGVPPCVPRKTGSYCGRWSSSDIGAGRSARKTSFIYAH
jgi:transposase